MQKISYILLTALLFFIASCSKGFYYISHNAKHKIWDNIHVQYQGEEEIYGYFDYIKPIKINDSKYRLTLELKKNINFFGTSNTTQRYQILSVYYKFKLYDSNNILLQENENTKEVILDKATGHAEYLNTRSAEQNIIETIYNEISHNIIIVTAIGSEER